MATSTILYIGFSFTDDYLNEFRAEVLKMLRPSPRLHTQFKVVLECLKLINKPEILSHFYDNNVHDDHLLDLKMASSRCADIKARIMAIDGITASDMAQIEKYVKERVVASSRRSGDFEEVDQLPPIAYAIIDSKSQQQITYFRRHEGVQMMTWKTDGWFGGLDAYPPPPPPHTHTHTGNLLLVLCSLTCRQLPRWDSAADFPPLFVGKFSSQKRH